MSALTEYGVELAVELGLGRQGGAGRWDAARWDTDAVWSNPDTALGDWVDVTCETESPLTLTAGASDADGVVTRWEAATCALRLWGDQFDPWSGPWAGVAGPMVALRVRWRPQGSPDWQAAFTGAVAADGWNWAPGRRPYVDVAATDSTQVLAAYDPLEGPKVGTGETASARVARILDLAHWPLALRDITPGGVKLKSSTMADAIWTQLLAVADTDLALLWVRRDGRLAFRPEGRVGVGVELAARLVVCDDGTSTDDVQVVTLGGAQFAEIRNIVSVSRQTEDDTEASTSTVTDDASIARYLAHSYSRTDLQHQSDAWSTTVAQAILQSSAWPSSAPREAALSSRLGDPRVPALLLSLEPDMTFDVEASAEHVWREACVGWRVTVGHKRIDGTLELGDVSHWVGARWDGSGWDADRWSFAVTIPATLEEAA